MRLPPLPALTLTLGLALGGCALPGQQAAPPPPPPSPTRTHGQADLRSEAQKAQSQAQLHRHPPLKLHVKPRFRDPVYGADVSWPQCPKGMGIPQRQGEGQPMPLPAAKYVVLGLTNGPGFTRNPCLADEFAWARDHHLMVGAYSVVSFPPVPDLARHGGQGPYDATKPGGRLANDGYAQAIFNVRTLEQLQLNAPFVWVDVEPYPVFPWSPDPAANALVVQGAVRGYQRVGYQVGFYSAPGLWKQVVGGLRFGLPEWRAGGKTGADEAARRCSSDWSFQGGPAVLGQWTDGTRDHNRTCPGTARQLDRFFHQY